VYVRQKTRRPFWSYGAVDKSVINRQSVTEEVKPLTEVGTALGYSVDELKQFITDEKMRMYKEKERER